GGGEVEPPVAVEVAERDRSVAQSGRENVGLLREVARAVVLEEEEAVRVRVVAPLRDEVEVTVRVNVADGERLGGAVAKSLPSAHRLLVDRGEIAAHVL